jgi:hypothetical protein
MIRPRRQVARGLNNNSNKLAKLPKRVRGSDLGLPQSLLEERGLSRGLKVVGSLMRLLQLLQLQRREVAAQSRFQHNFYSYIY